MSQEGKVSFVRFGFNVASLLGDSEDYSRYDVKACARNYTEQCYNRLHELYPDATIKVVFEAGVIGALSDSTTTEVLRMERLDDEEREATKLKECEVSDPLESEIVEEVCGRIQREYSWLEHRHWLTLAEAHRLFGIPIPVVRWACKEGLIPEAERGFGRWEFPREALASVSDNFVSVDLEIGFERDIKGAPYIFHCNLDATQHVRIVDFPDVQMIVVAPAGFGIPLLTKDSSSVLALKQQNAMDLVIEHFSDAPSWTEGPWTYDVFAKALVSQVKKQEGIGAEWLEDERAGKIFVEGMQFRFAYDGSLVCTLHDLIDRSIGVLADMVQETAIELSGGPGWKPEYEEIEPLFCVEVLRPLLRKMGFEFVRYTHGRKERGKDFTFSERTKFGEWCHYGLQAKAGNVSGEVNSEIDEILGQIDDAFRMPYREPGSREDKYISAFIVAISGHFTEGAQDKICNKMPQGFFGSVYFLDKEKIQGLISQYWPSEKGSFS